MNVEFTKSRRQQFMTKAYFLAMEKYHVEEVAHWESELHAEGDSEEQRQSLSLASFARFSFQLWALRYTGGAAIEILRDEFGGVIDAYERYQKALANYEQVPEIAPLGLGNIGDYERCMQLIGLCYLLHRRDLLPRIAALQDPAYFGDDALYEDLLSYALEGRVETDELLHIELYDPLLGAMYDDTDEESVADIREYVERWYPAFKYVPWHDGHLRINGTDGDYFGYWAFEAGAVAYLCGLADSSITHMVYPKDLVAWARAHEADYPNGGADEAGSPRANVPAGQACPETGWWFSPAKPDCRRYFKQGEVMPSAGSEYGQTFWQWSPDQSAPTL